jgi:hypothetical protein
VERLIGAGVEVSEASRNCQMLMTASVNNQVGARWCVRNRLNGFKCGADRRPTAQFSIADIAEVTRSKFTPAGLPHSEET